MAKPIAFLESNATLTAPAGYPDVLPLEIYRANNICTSCWKLSFKERLLVLFTGQIWLGVLSGNTQPPVLITATKEDLINVFDSTTTKDSSDSL